MLLKKFKMIQHDINLLQKSVAPKIELKKHFGKDPDDGFDDEDDEDDEDEIPVRKSSNNRSHPSKERRSG